MASLILIRLKVKCSTKQQSGHAIFHPNAESSLRHPGFQHGPRPKTGSLLKGRFSLFKIIAFCIFSFHRAFFRATASGFETLLQLPITRISCRTSTAALKFRVPSLDKFPLNGNTQLEDNSPPPVPVHPAPGLIAPSSLIHRVDISLKPPLSPSRIVLAGGQLCLETFPHPPPLHSSLRACSKLKDVFKSVYLTVIV